MNKLIGTKARVKRLLGFKGNGYYLVTSDNLKRLQQRYDVNFNELYPNYIRITEYDSNNDVESITNEATTLELEGESVTITQKRATIVADELLNKRYYTVDYESPHIGYELLYTGYEPTNYELTQRDYKLRVTTLLGYVSKIRPKTVGINILPTELIQ